MKTHFKHSFLSLIFLLSCHIFTYSQNILVNGGVNTGGITCDYNNTDSEFNSLASGLTSFAVNNAGEIDIMKSACIGGPAPIEGTTKLGIAHNAP